MRVAQPVQPSLVIEADRVHDERVSLPMADSVSHPCGGKILAGMLPGICVDVTDEVVVLKNHHDFAGNLHDLHREWVIVEPRDAWGKTLIDRIGGGDRLIIAMRGLVRLQLRLSPGGERGLSSLCSQAIAHLPFPDSGKISRGCSGSRFRRHGILSTETCREPNRSE